MQVLVSDANVLIDFDRVGFAGSIFRAQVEVLVADVLFEEELRARHSHLVTRGLQIRSLSPAAISETVLFARRYSRASRNDLLTLALARQESCILLTGDKDLRSAAQAEGVEVHGSLWLGSLLVERGALSVADLRSGFEKMREVGRRLPWSEIELLLDRLGR